MSINVKARQQTIGVGPNKGQLGFILTAELYNQISTEKVIAQAHKNSGIASGSLRAAWEAIGEVIEDWATEGHSVAIPGLGSMRFSVRASSVLDVKKVSTNLITSRRIIFTPSTDIKEVLANTPIEITCYDKDGKVITTVESKDDGSVEDGSDDTSSNSGTDSGTDGSSSGGTGGLDDNVGE